TGGGLFYGHSSGLGGGAGPFGTSGFLASTSITTSLDGINPIVKWTDPYPNGFNRPTGSSLGLRTLLGQSVGFWDRCNVTPYSAQWNFTVQREMAGNIVLEVGYAASRGLHFPENRQLNQLAPEFLSQGDSLRTQVANPFSVRSRWAPWLSGRSRGRSCSGPSPSSTASPAKALAGHPPAITH